MDAFTSGLSISFRWPGSRCFAPHPAGYCSFVVRAVTRPGKSPCFVLFWKTISAILGPQQFRINPRSSLHRGVSCEPARNGTGSVAHVRNRATLAMLSLPSRARGRPFQLSRFSLFSLPCMLQSIHFALLFSLFQSMLFLMLLCTELVVSFSYCSLQISRKTRDLSMLILCAATWLNSSISYNSFPVIL